MQQGMTLLTNYMAQTWLSRAKFWCPTAKCARQVLFKILFSHLFHGYQMGLGYQSGPLIKSILPGPALKKPVQFYVYSYEGPRVTALYEFFFSLSLMRVKEWNSILELAYWKSKIDLTFFRSHVSSPQCSLIKILITMTTRTFHVKFSGCFLRWPFTKAGMLLPSLPGRVGVSLFCPGYFM